MHARAYSAARSRVVIAASTLEAPLLTYIVAERRWRLEAEYGYRDDPTRIVVPSGFTFDLASIPRPLWGLIAPFELSISAPLLHDFLYVHGGALPPGAAHPPRKYSRGAADGLFLRMMKEEGVSVWRRYAAYWAVRAFGWASWRAA